MSDRAPVLETLAYAGHEHGEPGRGFRCAFWLCAIYVAAILVLFVSYLPVFRANFYFLEGAPLGRAFAAAFIAQVLLLPAIAFANVLPLVAYFRAWRQRRSPRNLVLVYAFAQPAMAATLWAAMAFLVHGSPWRYSHSLGAGMVMFGWQTLLAVPTTCVILSLPLIALFVPKFRRACLGRG